MEPSTYINIQNPHEVEITTHVPALPCLEEIKSTMCDNGEANKGQTGVHLTWKNLWVTVPNGKTGETRSILQYVTGYARPGEILAIMGPSGSGKSTLLDALAGRLDTKTRQSGDILVNGCKKTLAYGTSAYVTQDDTLITTLTVSESVYYSAQLQLPNSMSKADKKERAEMTIIEMGLQDSMDTRIGGWGAKGLSGGQKRRVSICIEILTRPKFLFLDEPTSGLDSAASYYVMSRIARLHQHEERTIIASIHQPCSEVFGLFHNLCLLSSGRTVFFRRTSSANEFFSTNGFPCPSFQNPSDHFLRTINKDFDETGETRSILQDVTGYARPGEILAIMGPSGSGKSTLLDALAGRLDSKTRQSGDILVNGCKKTLAYGTSAYVTQDDTLITTLTVRESVYYSAQLQLPNSMPKADKKERAEATIIEMGLQDSMDTRIGGWGAKGLSGGQKRRVSICIEILTRPKFLFLDEPTSGLDSAASYYVMSRIARLDQHEERTIIASIHQPCSEVFGLFHNLCLLSSGRTVFFGRTSSANEFFSTNGFPCPSFQNPPDHFLRTINKDFDEDIEQGSTENKPTEEIINMLIASYRSSTAHHEVNSIVAEMCKKGYGALDKKESHASISAQSFVLMKRSFINMHRDLGYYWLRLAIYLALSLGIGTLFYHVGSSYSSIQARSSMLMFVVSFLTFMAIGGFPSFVGDMKVFERERLNGHYTTEAFVIANTLSSAPYLLLVSVIPGALAYYMTGLREGFDHFVYYTSVLMHVNERPLHEYKTLS
nr:ABC transporter G family member 11-like [Tanacetum cinerariifolium]